MRRCRVITLARTGTAANTRHTTHLDHVNDFDGDTSARVVALRYLRRLAWAPAAAAFSTLAFGDAAVSAINTDVSAHCHGACVAADWHHDKKRIAHHRRNDAYP